MALAMIRCPAVSAEARMNDPSSEQDRQAARLVSGQAWDDFCDSLKHAGRLVLGAGVPDTPRDRAEGFRYLSRFLASGNAQCVTHGDPDYPVFARMIDYSTPWGLDNPDCLYHFAAIRGDCSYRISGNRGSANHIDIQANFGHFANGDISSWGTLSSIDGFDLVTEHDGSFELILSPTGVAGGSQALKLESNAEFVLVRQYFNDWENERPAELYIERVDAPYPIPPPRTAQVADRLDRLARWFDKAGTLWETMSRGMLGMPPNTMVIHKPDDAGERTGMSGQAYGMGNFLCEAGEAVVLEFELPQCHHWSVGLANYYWEAIEYASRQSSINGHQAVVDGDGVFRAVISEIDPGVPNWLDTAGHRSGTLTARFLRADRAPVPSFQVVAIDAVRAALPADTPRIDPTSRSEQLDRRRWAVWKRFRV
jgi:hypothetical protein